MPRVKNINHRTRTALKSLRDIMARDRRFLIDEISHVKGLMPLLMKPRNKQHWTPEDRAQLTEHLKRLSRISPYLAALAVPGGILMLPALAWWLDRRRTRGRTTDSARR